MKLLLFVVALFAVVYFFGIDVLFWIIGGIILLLIICGLLAGPSDNESTPDSKKPTTSKSTTPVYTSTRRKSEYVPNTKRGGSSVSNPLWWELDKEYVVGVGYRDKNGNYYDHKGLPMATPVIVKEKK